MKRDRIKGRIRMAVLPTLLGFTCEIEEDGVLLIVRKKMIGSSYL